MKIKEKIKTMKIKEKVKTMKALSKLLQEVEEPMNDLDLINTKDLCVMDPSQVCMVLALTEESKLLLKDFIKDGSKLPTIPDLNYQEAVKEGTEVKFSTEYLSKAIDILKCNGESFKLESAKDFPITLWNEQFKIIIAPRVTND